jgi:hypothetical protein
MSRTWHIVVSPASKPGSFAASVDGEPIGAWRTPLLSGARHLLATRNAHPDDEITLRHEGTQTISMRCSIAVAAKLTVKETGSGPMFKPYEPSEASGDGPEASQADVSGSEVDIPADDNARPEAPRPQAAA